MKNTARQGSVLIIVIAALALAAIGGLVYYALVGGKKTELGTKDIPIIGSTQPKTLEVKNISMKLYHKDIKAQNPTYDLQTANGHYLEYVFEDTDHTLYYDGQKVTQNSQLRSAQLSENGLHYTFMIGESSEDTGSKQIYVDNKLVKSVSDSRLVGVDNNGKDIWYIAVGTKKTPTSYNTGIREEVLYKTDKEVGRESLGYLDVVPSQGSNSYLAAARADTKGVSSVMIYSNSKRINLLNNGASFYKLSQDGKHYSYEQCEYKRDPTDTFEMSTNCKIYVDGVESFSSKGELVLGGISNTGKVAYIDSDAGSFEYDGHSAKLISAVTGYAYSMITTLLSADGKFVVGVIPSDVGQAGKANYTYQDIIGSSKLKTLTGATARADLQGNILYIYE